MPERPNLHVSKNLNISKRKQDIEKLKTPLRLEWKCCSVVFKIGSKIFSLQWHFKYNGSTSSNENFCVLPLFKTNSLVKTIGGGLAPPFAPPPSVRHCLFQNITKNEYKYRSSIEQILKLC